MNVAGLEPAPPHMPMYDKPQSQSSLYTPAHCKGMSLFTGLKNWLTFLLGLNIVFMEALLKMLPTLSVTPFKYGRSCGCLSTVDKPIIT